MSVRLTVRPLRLAPAYAELAGGVDGGVALFIGRVRPDGGRSGPVTHLFYEAHRAPALAALADLERSARARFGAHRVVLWHRLGRLGVGTASVIVGCAAPHRADAFAGCRYLIERLTAEVPIWKTEERRRRERPRRGRPGPRSGR